MYTRRKMESKIKSYGNWDESPRVDNNIKAAAVAVWFILWLECGKDYTMAYSISHKLYIIV